MSDSVGGRTQDPDTERQLRKVLLVFDATIHRDEGVLPTRRAAQQLAVRYPGPSNADYGFHLMADQLDTKFDGNVLVK